ncbi:uncharacterized protein LY79DRAFT_118868 [Colletotrichum navitas]|uniref:Uncharacterized protein n=1 Tax=Colletotrichum navitas TaxID=681940 RepID=A0AAD8Q4U7_9PEZI|nr:uncharacterized protein LY79DRAFT_118868 [Colletotrichum navitas]KAK1595107.1 hypothetical protein LY79DRAFT_118868 [Colletotrichum navitas]
MDTLENKVEKGYRGSTPISASATQPSRRAGRRAKGGGMWKESLLHRMGILGGRTRPYWLKAESLAEAVQGQRIQQGRNAPLFCRLPRCEFSTWAPDFALVCVCVCVCLCVRVCVSPRKWFANANRAPDRLVRPSPCARCACIWALHSQTTRGGAEHSITCRRDSPGGRLEVMRVACSLPIRRLFVLSWNLQPPSPPPILHPIFATSWRETVLGDMSDADGPLSAVRSFPAASLCVLQTCFSLVPTIAQGS